MYKVTAKIVCVIIVCVYAKMIADSAVDRVTNAWIQVAKYGQRQAIVTVSR